MDTRSVARRYDLDWLRVFTILCVFFFHSLRAFNLDPWSIKNPITYPWVQQVTSFFDVWIMPFFFLISGATIYYSLGKGKIFNSVGKFLKDKVLRLLVPLVVGIFTHILVDVYIDRVSNGKFSGTFFQFVPHYFDGLFFSSTAEGNFAFHGLHLWYLEILFVFSVILLPLFLLLKSKIGQKLMNALTRIMAVPGVFYVLLALPVVLCQTLLDPNSPLGKNWFSWSFPVYLCFFISGFVIISSERLQNSIRRLRWLSLAGAIALTAAWVITDRYAEWMSWFLVLTLLGFARQHLNINTSFLQYANEAVLPFYVEHQSVILYVGIFVLLWPIPDLVKWVILALISFVICIVFYEYAIRRNNLMRVLFGMKPRKVIHQTEAIPSPVTSA